MTDKEKLDFIAQVLRLTDGFAYAKWGNFEDTIYHHIDKDNNITFQVNCNDLFFWACSDSEELTPENFPRLVQALIDVRKGLGVWEDKPPRPAENASKEENEIFWRQWGIWQNAPSLAAILFCCRERQMMPQKPYFESIPKELHPLFQIGEPRTGHEHCCGIK
jgi:hypothetical protein